MIVELAIILALIVVNGLLAMSELAIVSSRPARLKVLIARGGKGSHRALKLASDPGRFLSTVQIRITLVGIVAGAYSARRSGCVCPNGGSIRVLVQMWPNISVSVWS